MTFSSVWLRCSRETVGVEPWVGCDTINPPMLQGVAFAWF